ncbi:hypothetical protein EBE87_26780 [Pseudoroseomonas wenyumeiae]|uniref:Uncharacterized protein n=1 Tax=Teichococcus wenyumeiae TaxID=2478470 RepID=A0A3A9JFR1_9PROT|nr:hypothetical protein [Pseudoroseomonas wenyumeiae]RKK02404.1 hypothetical protein D6Z83_20000 [Pseudoroseomonas wenyumeiae]RMI15202.1 hypothetical protein EBE87_26780 [Pseudoroseomonas wenyumeiae]
MRTTEPEPAVGIWLGRIHLALAVQAPTAHVLELPNKFAPSGEVWLAIQQQLSRGWGPFLGAPAPPLGWCSLVVLLWAKRRV